MGETANSFFSLFQSTTPPRSSSQDNGPNASLFPSSGRSLQFKLLLLLVQVPGNVVCIVGHKKCMGKVKKVIPRFIQILSRPWSGGSKPPLFSSSSVNRLPNSRSRWKISFLGATIQMEWCLW